MDQGISYESSTFQYGLKALPVTPSVRIEVAPLMWDSNWNQERANRGEDALFR